MNWQKIKKKIIQRVILSFLHIFCVLSIKLTNQKSQISLTKLVHWWLSNIDKHHDALKVGWSVRDYVTMT